MPKPPQSNEVKPLPELEKRTRRTFTIEYKLKILAQADACQHGELGELLRREKLYSAQLQQWRKEFAENGAEGLSKSAPGPAPSKSPEQKKIEKLEKQVAQLQHKLKVSEGCIDLQKKALSMLDQLNNGNEA